MGREKSLNRLRKNVTLGRRRTSVSLEEQVWNGLIDICRRENIGIDELCAAVEQRRVGSSMSSALRVFLLTYFRSIAEALEEGAGIDDIATLTAVLDRFHTEQAQAAGATSD
ncbi:MAG: ribbon-helix-helix domain-containing protein [Alphaproteobacteria bacterium]|nr:ribbon-helix-helix domain-containing protein [Alphaproteobacteria bacterium]